MTYSDVLVLSDTVFQHPETQYNTDQILNQKDIARVSNKGVSTTIFIFPHSPNNYMNRYRIYLISQTHLRGFFLNLHALSHAKSFIGEISVASHYSPCNGTTYFLEHRLTS